MSDTSFGFPVFNAQGQMQGNLTSIQGQSPLPDSTISSNPLTPLQTFNVAGTSNGSPASGNTTAPAGSAGVSTQTPASNTTATTTPAPSIGNYFARAIIVILGFIFVAVGLNMLKPGLVPVPSVPKTSV